MIVFLICYAVGSAECRVAGFIVGFFCFLAPGRCNYRERRLDKTREAAAGSLRVSLLLLTIVERRSRIQIHSSVT